MNRRETIELFHLLFLDQLGRKLDKQLYVLKGGCNLRFFFNSIRYSEDMDVDVKIIAKETLQKKVNHILSSGSLLNVLKTRGIQIQHISEAKQTATTQRWKIEIANDENDLLIHTKIEFSRRGFHGESQFSGVNPEIIRHYRLLPILANHYTLETALLQKIAALANRNHTQVRDLFDIYLLMNMGATLSSPMSSMAKDFKKAKDVLYNISYEAYKAQVIAYLHPEYQSQYDSKSLLNTMVTQINDLIEGYLS